MAHSIPSMPNAPPLGHLSKLNSIIKTPFTRAKKIGTARHAKFWHRADDFKSRHSQFSTCKRIGPTCNVAPVLKTLGVPRLPPGGSLGTGKRGTVLKIWRAVPIFLARVNGV